jgi:hypothetical protein
MNTFDIVIDLLVTADSAADAHAMLADSGATYGNVTVSLFSRKLWDVEMTSTIKTETVRTAAATLSDEFRCSLRELDPCWVAHVFYDGAEVLELDAFERGI